MEYHPQSPQSSGLFAHLRSGWDSIDIVEMYCTLVYSYPYPSPNRMRQRDSYDLASQRCNIYYYDVHAATGVAPLPSSKVPKSWSKNHRYATEYWRFRGHFRTMDAAQVLSKSNPPIEGQHDFKGMPPHAVAGSSNADKAGLRRCLLQL